MNIYLLLGHTDNSSLNAYIAYQYANLAQKAGHKVRLQKLGDMKFDPILWKGYKEIQTLEPDLVKAQKNIQWCDKWVIIYPVWWGNMPAILKGFLDRILLPGFAFKYHKTDPMWDKLLTGKTAHLITTSDAPWQWLALAYFNSDTHAMKNAVLEFCGIKPVTVTRIDNLRKLTPNQKKAKVDKSLGKKNFKI
jgi:putative NADPH-quinone reductase